MQKNTLLVGVALLVVGLIGGYFWGVSHQPTALSDIAKKKS